MMGLHKNGLELSRFDLNIVHYNKNIYETLKGLLQVGPIYTC